MRAQAIRLDENIIKAAKLSAQAQNRTVPKQIEYWARIGRISQENPDWNYEIIQGVLQGLSELETGEVEPYFEDQ